MKVGTLWRARFACFLALFASCAALASDDQESLQGILNKARNALNLRTVGGYALSAHVRVWVEKGSVAEGTYKMTWTPEGMWREEIFFGGYTRMKIGNGKHAWQVRSTQTESPYALQLTSLVNPKDSLQATEGDKLNQVRSEKINSVDAVCIRNTSSNGRFHTMCLDPTTGELLRDALEKSASVVPWEVMWKEYSQYQQWHDKYFARTIRGFNGKQTVMEVQFDEVKPLGELPADFFIVPKGATVWLDCPVGEAWKLKKGASPVYPEVERHWGAEGHVVLYIVIEEDGHISTMELAHSAGKIFDEAARMAVAQWQYQRTAACGDAQGRSEALTDFIFSIGRPYP